MLAGTVGGAVGVGVGGAVLAGTVGAGVVGATGTGVGGTVLAGTVGAGVACGGLLAGTGPDEAADGEGLLPAGEGARLAARGTESSGASRAVGLKLSLGVSLAR